MFRCTIYNVRIPVSHHGSECSPSEPSRLKLELAEQSAEQSELAAWLAGVAPWPEPRRRLPQGPYADLHRSMEAREVLLPTAGNLAREEEVLHFGVAKHAGLSTGLRIVPLCLL